MLFSCLQPYGMSHQQQLPGFCTALNAPKAMAWHLAHRCLFAVQEPVCFRVSLLDSDTLPPLTSCLSASSQTEHLF